jgi:hypothetical protein
MGWRPPAWRFTALSPRRHVFLRSRRISPARALELVRSTVVQVGTCQPFPAALSSRAATGGSAERSTAS